jgi:hypothetical protein
MALKRLVSEDSPAIWTMGTYIVFRNLGRQYTSRGVQKTNKYEVRTNDENSTVLGTISWFSRWRKYAFDPLAKTVYEEVCLREIAQFIEEETRAYRELRKVERGKK